MFIIIHDTFSTHFNTCPPYLKVESKITRDFEAQCSMFTCGGARVHTDYYYCHTVIHTNHFTIQYNTIQQAQ